MKLKDYSQAALLPEGWYELQLERVLWKRDRDMIIFIFKVIVGDYRGAEVVDVAMCRNTQDLWKLRTIFVALGVSEEEETGDPLEWDETFRSFTQSLIGKKTFASITQRADSSGKVRNTIISYSGGESSRDLNGLVEEKKEDDLPDWAKKELENGV